MTPLEIIRRQSLLINDRTNVEGIWTLIEQFVLPFRGEFYSVKSSESSIDWKKRKIYDSTAVDSSELLSASIHSNLTSLSNRWFDLSYNEFALNEGTETRAWLDNSQDKLWKSIVSSNFDLKVGEFYLDLVGYGNGFMQLDIDTKSSELIFDAIPIAECVFEQDTQGKLLKFYRSVNYTPSQIIEKFGKEVSEIVIEKEKSSPADKMELIFCVYKKEMDVGESEPDMSVKMTDKKMPFGYKWILKEDKSVLKEGSYYDMPFYFVPWRRTSGSVWGNGPATRCLSNILTLNEIVEQMLEGTAKAIDPPIFTTRRNVMGDINLTRGGLTVVSDIKEIREFVTNARLDVGTKQIDDLRKGIQSSFHIDNLQLKESPQMTATEVNTRYEIMQKLLGPTLGRIQIHLLDPIIERIFYHMLREKKFEVMPEAASGMGMGVQYVGPLPRAQQFKEAQGIQEFLAITNELSAIYPEAKYVPNIKDILSKLAELKGVNKSLLNDNEEISKIVEAEQEQQQRAAEAEIAKTQGQASASFANAGEFEQENV